MTMKEIAKKIIASINPGNADISGVGDGTIKGAIRSMILSLVDPMLATEEGFPADAKLTRDAIDELNSNLSVRYNSKTDMVEIYYNGKWNEWKKANLQSIILYYNGDENTELTGGWTPYAYKKSTLTSGYAKLPTVTKETDGMTISCISTGSWQNGSVFTEKPIDLTDYNSIEFEVNEFANMGDKGTGRICLTQTKENGYTSAYELVFTETEGKYTLDISNVVGSYYIAFGIGANNVTASYTVNNVVLN